MSLLNLLQIEDVAINIYTEIYNVPLNWIGNIIKFLVGAVGVGVGIILFSLILKGITLPFDVYQRVNMRKQNQKMKENQARMEKLQKQYANDKETYNKKVMEIYKENGLSTFSSCLPMILSMVIFFVAIAAFNQYSAYGSMNAYNKMVDSYSGNLKQYVAVLKDDDGNIIEENISWKIGTKNDENGGIIPNNTITFIINGSENDKYIYYKVDYGVKDAEKELVPNPNSESGYDFYAEIANTETGEIEYSKENVYPFIVDYIENKRYKENEGENKKDLTYLIDVEKFYYDQNDESELKKSVNEKKAAILYKAQEESVEKSEDDALIEAIKDWFMSPAQEAVVARYESEIKDDTKFLWIKNIWITDAAFYKHPVMNHKEFTTLIAERNGCSCGKSNSPALSINTYQETAYNEVTAKLTKQKGQSNGFFILIALSIGTILLQQFVSMRSQKEQQKYSSVDGQSGGQQKMMMIMMTGMFAIFSFMYSSAFSIYMIVSNLFSMLSTLVINKLVDVIAAKKEEKAEKAKYERRLSPKVEKGKKEKKLKSVKIKDEKTDKKDK